LGTLGGYKASREFSRQVGVTRIEGSRGLRNFDGALRVA